MESASGAPDVTKAGQKKDSSQIRIKDLVNCAAESNGMVHNRAIAYISSSIY